MNISGLGSSSYSYLLQTRSVSQSDQSDMAKQFASRLVQDRDADGDGSLSSEEIGVEQDLLSQADTDGDGKLSESELVGLMNMMGPPPPPMDDVGMSQASTGGSTSSEAGQGLSSLFSQLDTNGDGLVSEDEFLAGRPEEVTAEQAQEMWSRLDTSDSGSLSESQFESAMAAQGPPPGPPPGELSDEDDDSDDTDDSDASSSTSASDSDSTISDLGSLLASLLANYGLARYQQSMNSDLVGLLSDSLNQDTGGISITA